MELQNKIIYSFFLIFSFLFIFASQTLAQSNQTDFYIDANARYQVDENGITHVTKEVIIENAKSEVMSKEFVLNLNNVEPISLRVYEGEEQLSIKENRVDGNSIVRIEFDNPIAGIGKKRRFKIEFSEVNFATKTGEVWEVSIPKLDNPDLYRNYKLTLSVPSSFGQEAYVAPEPLDVTRSAGRNEFLFDKNLIKRSAVSVGFGEFQVFDFNLNYHLENPLNSESEIEIAIPPDTAYQKMFYKTFDPEPENVRIDPDSNWIAEYTLSPRERLDVKIIGSVQILSTPRPFPMPLPNTLLKNTKATEYWQANDPQIKTLANMLKEPEDIFNFVVEELSYNYNRVEPNSKRLGAKQVLENSDQAICMEFTDLFVALARAAGIPAREVNGYAYTENKNLQPLSLVADVLHAWPEYWDDERNAWIPVDPTWADTTGGVEGGVDYFNKLDLRHFSFVMHGISDTKPFPPGSYKLGSEPQKDVFVEFGELPEERYSDINIQANVSQQLNITKSTADIEVRNSGSVAAYDTIVSIKRDNQVIEENYVPIIPPFAKYQRSISIDHGPFAAKSPQRLRVDAKDKTLSIPISKTKVVTYHLLALSSIFILIILSFYVRAGKINIAKFLNKLKLYETNRQTGEEKANQKTN